MTERAAADDAPRAPSSADSSSARSTQARGAKENAREYLRANWRLVSVLGLLTSGVVFVMLGWYGAANTNIITEQIPYLISGGLLGLGLIIVAGIMAASASSDREVNRLREELARVAAGGVGSTARYDATSPVATNGRHVFSVPGGRSYHEPGCPILEGKDGVEELQPASAHGAGLVPCKLCSAD